MLGRSIHRLVLGLALAGLGAGCSGHRTTALGMRPAPAGLAGERESVTSNILRRDYAGSAACATCQSAIFVGSSFMMVFSLVRAHRDQARSPWTPVKGVFPGVF